MASDGQILFFEKSFIDFDQPNATITITDNVAIDNGQASVNLLRNRNNISGWVTTESDDTANTEILINTGDIYEIDFIELIRHNFKDFTIEFKNNLNNWEILETVTNNEKETSVFILDNSINTRELRITIQATMIANADKSLRQIIVSRSKYSLNGFPLIKKPTHSKDRKKNKTLSGRTIITDRLGAFSCELDIKLTRDDNDLSFHEDMYNQNIGVLMLLSGGKEEQFSTLRKGYKNEDIVLVSPIDEYVNPYDKGVYTSGIRVRMKLAEVVS
jgi:hypothetical protein